MPFYISKRYLLTERLCFMVGDTLCSKNTHLKTLNFDFKHTFSLLATLSFDKEITKYWAYTTKAASSIQYKHMFSYYNEAIKNFSRQIPFLSKR